MDEAHEGAAAQDPVEPEPPLDPEPAFYERPVWRALLIVGTVLGICALFAVLFPPNLWRF